MIFKEFCMFKQAFLGAALFSLLVTGCGGSSTLSAGNNEEKASEKTAEILKVTAGTWLPYNYINALKKTQSIVKMGGVPAFTSITVDNDNMITAQTGGVPLPRSPLIAEERGWTVSDINGFFTMEAETGSLIFTNRRGRETLYSMAKGNDSFERLVNQAVLAGRYISLNDNVTAIAFMVDGTVSGLRGYNRYRICFRDEELEQNNTGYDLVYLYHSSRPDNGSYFVLIIDNGVISFNTALYSSADNRYRSGRSQILLARN
jgi:hypothetical protein